MNGESSLEAYAYPLIGRLSVAEIDNAAVLRVLHSPRKRPMAGTERLWTAVPDRAKKLQNRIEAVLGWSICRRATAPATTRPKWDLLKHQLPAKSTLARGKVRHHPRGRNRRYGRLYAAPIESTGMGARALSLRS